MKKIVNSLIFTLLVFNLAIGQPPKGMGQSDPAAKKILDGVSTKFKTFKAIQAKFALKIENSAGKSIGSKSGTLYMKGTKYHVSITGQEIFCDGSNVWTYTIADKEVVITKLDLTANTITPQKLFTNFYDKDFLYKLNSEKAGIQEIELTPIDKTKPFYKVLLTINKAGKTIASSKVFEKTGNRYTMSQSSINSNATIADTQFVFDAKKYPGVEVVDNR